MQTLELTANFQLLDSGIATAVVMAAGTSINISYTGVDAEGGFPIPSGIPLDIPQIAAFGGSLYARAYNGGSIRYETA
jgi:hypothetical protein